MDPASINEFIMPERVIYGDGSFKYAGREAARLGDRALIISDPVMEQLGLVGRLADGLERASLSCEIYTGVGTEPTDVYVKEALDLCKQKGCNVLVAIGGGSCLDTAKAVGIMATNHGELGDYLPGKEHFVHKPIPLVAIPTTAGTGSEVTKVTVITDTRTDVKMMIADPLLMPAVALVDPSLTLSCPPKITAATGVDALCHAIEAYLSRKAHPMTDLAALKAIELIARHLPKAYTDGQHREAREQMAYAAMLAGIAFSNASVTLVHGMSRPLGALFHVPHGISNAMLLSTVLAYSKDACAASLQEIGRILSEDHRTADDAIAWIRQFCRQLDIPSLQQWGLEPAQFERNLDKMAADALASGSPANHPIIPTHEEIVDLYRKAFQ